MNYHDLAERLKKEISDTESEIEYLKSEIRKIDERQFLFLHSESYSERHLYRIINKLPINIYWCDKDLYCIGCNQAMLDVFGVPLLDDIVGVHLSELIPKDILDRLNKNNRRVIEHGETFDGVEEGLDAEGNRAIYHTKKVPMRDRNGTIYGIAGISIDITDRVKHEQELKRANEKVEMAHRAQKDFVNNMSYDIRTPCTGIIGVVKNLLAQELDPIRRTHLGYIEESSEKLLHFFNDIFDVLSLEEGEFQEQESEVDLAALVNDVINLYLPRLKEKALDCFVEIAPDLPKTIHVRKQSLYRVLMNLVSNAIKFTSSGHVRLSLSRCVRIGAPQLKIEIEDTGIGIAPCDQERIFKRFTRLTSAYKGGFEGSGIGLYVTKQLVESLSGVISVSSNISSGVTFTCIIPLSLTSAFGRGQSTKGGEDSE